MDLELKNQVAVITGGSVGIGLAVARGLAAEEYTWYFVLGMGSESSKKPKVSNPNSGLKLWECRLM